MKVHLVDGTYELFRSYFGAPEARSPANVEVGDPGLPQVEGKETVAELKWRHDSQDSPVIPSRGNFVLASVPGASSGRALYDSLKAQGVLVRFFDKPGLDDKLRITIGTPDENSALLRALDRSR